MFAFDAADVFTGAASGRDDDEPLLRVVAGEPRWSRVALLAAAAGLDIAGGWSRETAPAALASDMADDDEEERPTRSINSALAFPARLRPMHLYLRAM